MSHYFTSYFINRTFPVVKNYHIYEKTYEGEPQGLNFECMANDFTGENMRISKLMVAYSRPKKLQDCLCPRKLDKKNDKNGMYV